MCIVFTLTVFSIQEAVMVRREFLIGAILLATVLLFLAVQSIGEESHAVNAPELIFEQTAHHAETDHLFMGTSIHELTICWECS